MWGYHGLISTAVQNHEKNLTILQRLAIWGAILIWLASVAPTGVLLLMTLACLLLPAFAGPAMALTLLFTYLLPSFAITVGIPLIFNYVLAYKDQPIEDEAIEWPCTEHTTYENPQINPSKHARAQNGHENEPGIPPPYESHREKGNPPHDIPHTSLTLNNLKGWFHVKHLHIGLGT